MYRLACAALLSFTVVSLSGCGGGDATDESTSPTATGPSTGSTAKQAASSTAAPSYAPVEDDATTRLGTLRIGEKPFELREAIAYKAKHTGDPCTVVLLTDRPLNERQLDELNDIVKERSEDVFAAFVPHIKLRFDESGELMALFAWADNLSASVGAPDGVVLDIQQTEDRISGTAKMPEPGEFFDTTYQFDATFDVEVLSSADE